MPKPIPYLRYDLNEDQCIGLDKNNLTLVDEATGTFEVPIAGHESDVAAVLLALAENLLSRLGEQDALTVLKESSLGDVLRSFLGQAPNVNVRNVHERNVMNERMNERNEQSGRQTKFTQETEQSLLESGLSLDIVRYLSSMSGMREAIENSSNPAASARTIFERDKHQKAFPVWLKKNPAPKTEAAPAKDQRGDSAAPDKIYQICDECGERESNCKCELPRSRAFEIED